MLLPVYDLLTRVLGSARVYDALATRPELTGARRVLEIGCGTGNLTLRVSKACPSAQLTGLDPDPRALGIARRKGGNVPRLNFEQGYAQELPYADGAFDRVLSSMMLHRIGDAESESGGQGFPGVPTGGVFLVADIRASDDAITRLLHDAGFEHGAIGETRLGVRPGRAPEAPGPPDGGPDAEGRSKLAERLGLQRVELGLGDGAGVQQSLGVGDLLGGRAARGLLDVVVGLLLGRAAASRARSAMPLPRAIRYTSAVSYGIRNRKTTQTALTMPEVLWSRQNRSVRIWNSTNR